MKLYLNLASLSDSTILLVPSETLAIEFQMYKNKPTQELCGTLESFQKVKIHKEDNPNLTSLIKEVSDQVNHCPTNSTAL